MNFKIKENIRRVPTHDRSIHTRASNTGEISIISPSLIPAYSAIIPPSTNPQHIAQPITNKKTHLQFNPLNKADGSSDVSNVELDFMTFKHDHTLKDLKENFGLNEKDLKNLFQVPGIDSKIKLNSRGTDVHISGEFFDQTKNSVGKFTGKFLSALNPPNLFNPNDPENGKGLNIDGLMFGDARNQSAQDKGRSKKLLENLMSVASQKDFKYLKAYADITIGKYAWASAGFEYVDPKMLPTKKKTFREYVKNVSKAYSVNLSKDDVNLIIDKIYASNSPKELSQIKVPGLDLLPSEWFEINEFENADVTPDKPINLGKAFFLDENDYTAHGSWYGILKF